MALAEIAETLRSFWGLWLMILFLGIVFTAYRPANKARFTAYGDIPLRDDEKER